MSKVMRAIDAKSFIIGVLSAVIVVMAMGADDETGDAFDFFNDGSQKLRRTDETPSAESPIYDDPFADDFSSVPSVCDSWDYNQRWKVRYVPTKEFDMAAVHKGFDVDIVPAVPMVGWELIGGSGGYLTYRRPICDKP